jgi:hypothetical protein
MAARKRERIAADEARRELERQQEQARQRATPGQSLISLAANALLEPSAPAARPRASGTKAGAWASSSSSAQASSSSQSHAGTWPSLSSSVNAHEDLENAQPAPVQPVAPSAEPVAPAISEAAQLAALARLPAPPSWGSRRQRARERENARAD